MIGAVRAALARRARGEAGFTIVEAVVAVTLFGMFAASLLTLVLGTMKLTVDSQRRVTAAQLASQELDRAQQELAAGGLLDAMTGTGDFADGSTITVEGIGYDVSREFTLASEEGGALCRGGATGVSTPSLVVGVAIVVTWDGVRTPVRIVQSMPVAGRGFVVIQMHDGRGQPAPDVNVRLSWGSPGGLLSNETVRKTGADGCMVFDVNLSNAPVAFEYEYYAGDADTISATVPSYVQRNWRFGTPTMSLGVMGAEGGVISASHEVRQEATLRFVIVDNNHALSGQHASDHDLVVNLVATEGLAADAVQPRPVSEIDLPRPASGTPPRDLSFPMSYRDLTPSEIWWDGFPAAPGTQPREFVVRQLWPALYGAWIRTRPTDLHYVDLPPGGEVRVLISVTGEIVDIDVGELKPPENLFVNGGFESPEFAGELIATLHESLVPGWRSTGQGTGSLERIELWRSGFDGVPSHSGRQIAEINAVSPGSLYQDVGTTPGQTLVWSLAHRGRRGVDTMRVTIGPPEGARTQSGPDISTGTDEWVEYSGTYVVPPGQTVTRFSFESVSTHNGSPSIGNLIDSLMLRDESDPEPELPPGGPDDVPTDAPSPAALGPEGPEPLAGGPVSMAGGAEPGLHRRAGPL